MRNTHMKFQIHNMHHSEVNGRTHTHRQTDTQTSQKQYALPTFSKLHFVFKGTKLRKGA